jgi:hypothetical protein
MPVVRIKGWPRDARPGVPPDALIMLLRHEAGMDSLEAKEAVTRLMDGKSVDAYFDLGETKAAPRPTLDVPLHRGRELPQEVAST